MRQMRKSRAKPLRPAFAFLEAAAIAAELNA
jgi:hypothetical protein